MLLTNDIKRTFLSFAQTYFRDVHPTLKWNVDARVTKIFIGDKNIAAPSIVDKTPSIILARGSMSYIQSSIDQVQYQNTPIGPPETKQRTDLVRGTVTYNCASQNGVEAEEIANLLFLNIVGFKDQFRHNKIHQILGVSIGEEQLARSDVSPRLSVVPVTVMFTAQTTSLTTTDLYTIQITEDGDYRAQMPLDWQVQNVAPEMLGYTISGLTLTFTEPPASGIALRATYTGRFTMNRYTDVTPAGIIDGANNVFTLEEEVYSPYLTLSGIVEYGSVASGLSI
jgi:hypothetical protein